MVRYRANPEYKEKKKLRAREAYYERTKDMPRMKGGRKPKDISTDTTESMLSIKERLKATPKPVGRPRKYDNQKKDKIMNYIVSYFLLLLFKLPSKWHRIVF